MEDILRSLGHVTLGSRLRRIGERLQLVSQAYIASLDIDVPAAHFPVLATLDRLGPLTVNDLAQALQISQPNTTRMVDKLRKTGLVTSKRAAGDRRVRWIALSDAGHELVGIAKQIIWPVLDAALKEQCGELSGSLLEQLSAFEDALVRGEFAAILSRMDAERHGDAPA